MKQQSQQALCTTRPNKPTSMWKTHGVPFKHRRRAEKMTSLTVERVLLLQPYLKHDGFNKKNEIKKALKRLQSIKNDSSRRVTNILGSGLASAPPSTTQWLYQRAVTWNSTVFRFRHQPYVYCGVLRTALLTNQLSSCIIFTWHGHRNLFLFECVQTMLNFQLHFSHFFHSKIRCGYE